MKIEKGNQVNGKKITQILCEFVVLHHEWELDGYGYIVCLEDDSIELILTNHGIPYIAKASHLKEQIKTYENAIKMTERAIDLYTNLREK